MLLCSRQEFFLTCALAKIFARIVVLYFWQPFLVRSKIVYNILTWIILQALIMSLLQSISGHFSKRVSQVCFEYS